MLFHMMFYTVVKLVDDIVVFSSSWEDNCSHLTVVLKKLQDAGLIFKTRNVSGVWLLAPTSA